MNEEQILNLANEYGYVTGEVPVKTTVSFTAEGLSLFAARIEALANSAPSGNSRASEDWGYCAPRGSDNPCNSRKRGAKCGCPEHCRHFIAAPLPASQAASDVIQYSDELTLRSPTEKAAYLEGIEEGKMRAKRDAHLPASQDARGRWAFEFLLDDGWTAEGIDRQMAIEAAILAKANGGAW